MNFIFLELTNAWNGQKALVDPIKATTIKESSIDKPTYSKGREQAPPKWENIKTTEFKFGHEDAFDALESFEEIKVRIAKAAEAIGMTVSFTADTTRVKKGD